MSPSRWKKNSVLQVKEEREEEEESTISASGGEELCYPNCDLNIWLRSCDAETIEPLQGVAFGCIPDWINGSLYRNGPGKQRYENQSVNHLFDASGLLHR